jgi:uncharacterized protein (TIGR03067 family)
LIATPFFLGRAGAQAPEKEQDKLQGTWVPIKLVYNGKDLTESDKVKFKLVFKGDQITVTGSESVTKEYGKLSFKLDPSTMPRILDIKVKVGSQKDAVLEGIYELNKDELKLCASIFGMERPSKFEAPAGSSFAFAVLKRER